MNSDFGVGFSGLLFENANQELVEELKERLFTQVGKYLPFINILDVNVRIEENTAFLRVNYFIPNISVSDTLELDIKDNFG